MYAIDRSHPIRHDALTGLTCISRPVKILIAAIAIVAAIVLIYIYSTFDPSADGSLFPRCTFKTLTGLDCPGCGSQRAIHALLHGHVVEALRLNALFVIELPLLLLLALTSLFTDRFHRLRRILVSRTFILILLATIIGFTIVRNLV